MPQLKRVLEPTWPSARTFVCESRYYRPLFVYRLWRQVTPNCRLVSATLIRPDVRGDVRAFDQSLPMSSCIARCGDGRRHEAVAGSDRLHALINHRHFLDTLNRPDF
mmetsp:Transcript_1878/g.5691  ORF Transcript_1878/g.5691 Transcript_1878/m.5691 type:complete len:107 (+) Transcript_1878:965-1285(+)